MSRQPQSCSPGWTPRPTPAMTSTRWGRRTSLRRTTNNVSCCSVRLRGIPGEDRHPRGQEQDLHVLRGRRQAQPTAERQSLMIIWREDLDLDLLQSLWWPGNYYRLCLLTTAVHLPTWYHLTVTVRFVWGEDLRCGAEAIQAGEVSLPVLHGHGHYRGPGGPASPQRTQGYGRLASTGGSGLEWESRRV